MENLLNMSLESYRYASVRGFHGGVQVNTTEKYLPDLCPGFTQAVCRRGWVFSWLFLLSCHVNANRNQIIRLL
jgi:hypothetical protein